MSELKILQKIHSISNGRVLAYKDWNMAHTSESPGSKKISIWWYNSHKQELPEHMLHATEFARSFLDMEKTRIYFEKEDSGETNLTLEEVVNPLSYSNLFSRASINGKIYFIEPGYSKLLKIECFSTGAPPYHAHTTTVYGVSHGENTDDLLRYFMATHSPLRNMFFLGKEVDPSDKFRQLLDPSYKPTGLRTLILDNP